MIFSVDAFLTLKSWYRLLLR